MTEAVLERPTTIPAQGEWTYEAYLALPNDGKRYEIIEGVLYVANVPKSDSSGEYAQLDEFTDNERIQSAVLEGIDIVVSTIFG